MASKPTRNARARLLGPSLGVVLLAILLFLPSLALAAHPAESANVSSAPGPEPSLPGDLALTAYADFSTNLLDGEMSERDFNLLNLGVLEQQGMSPRGWYAAVQEYQRQEAAALQQDKAPPPKFVLRDMFLVCDLNGDNVDDVVANSIDLATGRPFVQAFSGGHGFTLWIRYGVRYFPPGAIFPGYQPGTQPLPPNPFPPPNNPTGLPAPRYPQNMGPTVDINEDGVCDFLFMSQSATSFGIDPQVILVDTTYSVINGSYGYQTLWSNVQRSQIVVTHDFLFNGAVVMCIDMTDFPTGLLVFQTPNGARWARKTTFAHYCHAPCVFDWRSSDTIFLQDITRWRIYWSRTVNISRQDNPTSQSQEEVNNITHLMGVAQLGGDDEYEVVLLQPQFSTPRNQPGCNPNNPVDGSPLFRFGTGGSVLTLRGELAGGGKDFWKQLIYDEGSLRVNLAMEESFETVLLMWLQIVGDLTQDKVPEVIVTFLAVEQSAFSPTTTNGRFRTHLVPLSGSTGQKLWRGEPKVQGWGFVADMNPDASTSLPLLALGTVDYPTPIPSGARFPPKDVRLTVYNVTDGTPRWSYREQFAQDTYLSYDMSLNQYLSALAPHDWTGDGVKDLVTPSQFYPATGANQTLLAHSENRFQILDGMTGGVHASATAWGPAGILVSCGPGVNGAGEPTLTVFSGHSKRYDISRFNITPAVTQHWRFPLFNNPDMQSATLGTDISFIGAQCRTTRDGRTIFNLNLGLASMKRGVEIVDPYGSIGVNEDDRRKPIEVLWIDPPVRGKPPLSVDEILQYFEVEETHPGLMLAFTAGPAVPGLVAGLALGRLRTRKGGSS